MPLTSTLATLQIKTAPTDQDGPISYQYPSQQQLLDLRRSVFASTACRSFKICLRKLMHRLYHSRLAGAIGVEVVGSAESFLQKDALRTLLDDFSWLPAHLFCFQQPETIGLPFPSRLRGFVEQRTRRAFARQTLDQKQLPIRQGFLVPPMDVTPRYD